MFRYFYQNRCNYKKGQLASFFVVILVILIIMAMVSVNLNKVAFIKTESANGADAGALAAGSVMANLFNALGKSNRDMEEAYREFFHTISLLFVMAIEHLTTAYISAYHALNHAKEALALACVDPCRAYFLTLDAMQEIETAIQNNSFLMAIINEEIMPEITDFQNEQLAFYIEIRDTAAEAHCKAIKMGHKFAFMNSGIGEKMRDRGSFNDFLENLDCQPQQTFNWTDQGQTQNRRHMVEVTVNIDPVDTFELKVTRNTYSQEMADLMEIISKCEQAHQYLIQALINYDWAAFFLMLACFVNIIFCIFAIPFLINGINANNNALTTLSPLFTDLPEAWEKLLPSEQTFISTTDGDADDQIICWMEEIIHNRLVRVDTKQQHEGREEEGIWTARYPDITSFSVVNFNGQGQIHRPLSQGEMEGPVLRHNPSIIETDTSE